MRLLSNSVLIILAISNLKLFAADEKSDIDSCIPTRHLRQAFDASIDASAHIANGTGKSIVSLTQAGVTGAAAIESCSNGTVSGVFRGTILTAQSIDHSIKAADFCIEDTSRAVDKSMEAADQSMGAVDHSLKKTSVYVEDQSMKIGGLLGFLRSTGGKDDV